MNDFVRAFYADLFDTEDPKDLDHATEEWSQATSAERSFAQVHLLWLIHEQLANLGPELANLGELLAHLNRPPEPLQPELIEVVDAEVIDA